MINLTHTHYTTHTSSLVSGHKVLKGHVELSSQHHICSVPCKVGEGIAEVRIDSAMEKEKDIHNNATSLSSSLTLPIVCLIA